MDEARTSTPTMSVVSRKLRTLLSLARFSSFDTSSEAGRSLERYRRIFISAVTSIAARGVNTICLLVAVPLTIDYLGKERYGLWIAVTSAVALLSFADLGLGGGLLNQISASHGRDDRQEARRLFGNALCAFIAPVLLLSLIFLSIYPFVRWDRVFNVFSEQAKAESGPTIAIFILTTLLSLPFNSISSVYTGYQEMHKVNMWLTIQSVASFLSLLAAIHVKASLPVLTAAFCGTTLAVRTVNFVVLLCFEKPWLRVRISDLAVDTMLRLLKSGSLFLVISMSIAIGYTSNTLVITQLLGVESVAEFSVPYRLFSVVTLLVSSFLIPMWPAYGEAFVRGDYPWVRSGLIKSLWVVTTVNTVSGILMYFVGNWIIHLWVGDAVQPGKLLLFAFALYLIVHGMHGPMSMFLNGLNVIRLQAILWLSMAVVNLALSILLTMKIGVPGVVLGTVISTFFCFVVPAALYTRNRLRKLLQQSAARGN